MTEGLHYQRRVWTRQPPETIGIRRDRGWQAGWSFNSLNERGGVGPVVLGADSSRIVGIDGRRLSVSGSGGALGRAVLNAGRWDKPGDGDFTVAIKFRAVATQYCIIGRWNTGASPTTCDWYVGSGDLSNTAFVVACGSSTYTASVAASWTANTEYALIARRRGTTITVDRINYATGARHTGTTTNAGITTINSNSARSLKLGEIDLAASYNSNLDASVAAIANRAISDVEVESWFRNPWQSFAPANQPIFYSLPGTGASDLSGAATEARDVAAGTSDSEWDVSSAATEAKDVAAGTATSIWDIAGAATEAQDAAAATVGLALSVSAAATEAQDAAASSVGLAVAVDGAATESQDVAAGTATSSADVTGSATEAADSASATVSNPQAVAEVYSGGWEAFIRQLPRRAPPETVAATRRAVKSIVREATRLKKRAEDLLERIPDMPAVQKDRTQERIANIRALVHQYERMAQEYRLHAELILEQQREDDDLEILLLAA